MRTATLAVVLAALVIPATSRAGDVVTTPAPGVEILHRTTPEPQDLWAARVDLSSPNLALHSSSGELNVERHVTTPTFAKNAGAFVAINGDWSDATTPVGLAISEGAMWHSHLTDPALASQWGFIGCTIGKKCTLGIEQILSTAWWFADPTRRPYRFFQAIGANGVPLVQGGVATGGCYDAKRNPRSAACLEPDGVHLRLVVVDGRTDVALGMTCDETRALLVGFGCQDAVMLDGGGSSTLVVDGKVKNNPSDGTPRVVANHLGVIYNPDLDPTCKVANGRFCEGNVLHTCEAGLHKAPGDCSKFGATCQEDGDYAFCVDMKCPNADGNGARCTDATHVESCNDGVFGGGDCGFFGYLCGTDALGAGCMDPRCTAGPHASLCTANGALGTCKDGAYTEAACPAGAHCAEALCLDDRCASPDSATCEGALWRTCAKGVYAEVDCAAKGEACVDGAGCGGGTGGGGTGGHGAGGAGGAVGQGGASSGTGGASSAGGWPAGVTAAPAASGEDSGCSVAAQGASSDDAARSAIALLVIGIAASRGARRRRAVA